MTGLRQGRSFSKSCRSSITTVAIIGVKKQIEKSQVVKLVFYWLDGEFKANYKSNVIRIFMDYIKL